jgi:hypothetical protein
MPVEPGFQASELRRGQLDAIRENTSRLAVCQTSYETHGNGEFKLPTCTYFTCTFVTRPHIAAGLSVDGDALQPHYFPRVTVGVYRWLTDVKGYYTGAWVFFVVSTRDPCWLGNTSVSRSVKARTAYVGSNYDPCADPGYDLIHDLQFTGIAIKELPSHLLDN